MEKQANLEKKVKKFKLGKKIAFSLVIGAVSAISLLQGCAYNGYYRDYPYRSIYEHHHHYYPSRYYYFDGCDGFGGYYRGFGGCW